MGETMSLIKGNACSTLLFLFLLYVAILWLILDERKMSPFVFIRLFFSHFIVRYSYSYQRPLNRRKKEPQLFTATTLFNISCIYILNTT